MTEQQPDTVFQETQNEFRTSLMIGMQIAERMNRQREARMRRTQQRAEEARQMADREQSQQARAAEAAERRREATELRKAEAQLGLAQMSVKPVHDSKWWNTASQHDIADAWRSAQHDLEDPALQRARERIATEVDSRYGIDLNNRSEVPAFRASDDLRIAQAQGAADPHAVVLREHVRAAQSESESFAELQDNLRAQGVAYRLDNGDEQQSHLEVGIESPNGEIDQWVDSRDLGIRDLADSLRGEEATMESRETDQVTQRNREEEEATAALGRADDYELVDRDGDGRTDPSARTEETVETNQALDDWDSVAQREARANEMTDKGVDARLQAAALDVDAQAAKGPQHATDKTAGKAGKTPKAPSQSRGREQTRGGPSR